MKVPRSTHETVKGIVYFGRMLDKIRLKAGGELPPGYFLGTTDPTHFDARCTKFLEVDYDKLARRALEGGTDKQILEWAFQNGRKPSAEQITVWNAFLLKRGWRDESSEELRQEKAKAGVGDRADIQTWVDLQDADEGRKLKHS